MAPESLAGAEQAPAATDNAQSPPAVNVSGSPIEESATAVAPKPKTPSALGKMKTTVKIPTSLKSARSMMTEQTVAEKKESSTTKEASIQPDLNLPDQEYTPEQFMEAWQKYAMEVKAAGRQGEYIVMKEAPELPGNHIVRVRITNSVQQDFFEKAKSGAQLFLRKALQNRQISLECVMVKEEEGKRLYTAHEKFGYLLKKYPQLQVLKEKLGLEADF